VDPITRSLNKAGPSENAPTASLNGSPHHTSTTDNREPPKYRLTREDSTVTNSPLPETTFSVLDLPGWASPPSLQAAMTTSTTSSPEPARDFSAIPTRELAVILAGAADQLVTLVGHDDACRRIGIASMDELHELIAEGLAAETRSVSR
jgi:hypothetical protein